MTKNFRLFSSVLYFFAALSSSAVAAVDITGRPRIEVSDWNSLKAAVIFVITDIFALIRILFSKKASANSETA